MGNIKLFFVMIAFTCIQGNAIGSEVIYSGSYISNRWDANFEAKVIERDNYSTFHLAYTGNTNSGLSLCHNAGDYQTPNEPIMIEFILGNQSVKYPMRIFCGVRYSGMPDFPGFNHFDYRDRMAIFQASYSKGYHSEGNNKFDKIFPRDEYGNRSYMVKVGIHYPYGVDTNFESFYPIFLEAVQK